MRRQSVSKVHPPAALPYQVLFRQSSRGRKSTNPADESHRMMESAREPQPSRGRQARRGAAGKPAGQTPLHCFENCIDRCRRQQAIQTSSTPQPQVTCLSVPKTLSPKARRSPRGSRRAPVGSGASAGSRSWPRLTARRPHRPPGLTRSSRRAKSAIHRREIRRSLPILMLRMPRADQAVEPCPN